MALRFERMADVVAGLPDERCRRIAIAAARRSLQAWHRSPTLVEAALVAATAGSVPASLLGEMERVAASLDDRYLDLFDDDKEGGRSEGWETAFHEARAAAAVVAACGPDPRAAAAAALYEASFALGEDLYPLAGDTE